MDLEANTSFDSNHGSVNDSKQDARKQQFTTKQRMDMYAFCVLELELHGNTVSIKKQQQAIQKALKKDQTKGSNKTNGLSQSGQSSGANGVKLVILNEHNEEQDQQQQMNANGGNHMQQPGASGNHLLTHDPMINPNEQADYYSSFQQQHHQQSQQSDQSAPQSSSMPMQHHHTQSALSVQQQPQDSMSDHHQPMQTDTQNGNGDPMTTTLSGAKVEEKKTLLELQEEIAKTQRCYSDRQKTQVLTSSMLREVQRRFSMYYPDTPCPSRTTIKHVFMKCVENGTVENVKNPRKPTKIPNGDQIEQFLSQEPQMSLREMAKKLNVSTGTVSRRCRALGIVPESVTLKHRQMAMAKRQKQIKNNPSSKTKGSTGKRGASSSASSRQQHQQQQQNQQRQAQMQPTTMNHHHHHHHGQYANGLT